MPTRPSIAGAKRWGLASVCVCRNTHVPGIIRTNPSRLAWRSELSRNNPNQVELAPTAIRVALASPSSLFTIATIVTVAIIHNEKGIMTSNQLDLSPANENQLPIVG